MEEEDDVAADARVVDTDIVQANPRYGVSDWNERFRCHTCCFCARPLTDTLAQQQWRANEERYAPLRNTEWQDDIDRRIALQWKGATPSWRALSVAYRQQIHAACNSIMTATEGEQMAARCRDRIAIPDENEWGLNVQLDYAAMALSGRAAPLCERCDECLRYEQPGLCYVGANPLNPRERRYLHLSCYDYLRAARAAEQET